MTDRLDDEKKNVSETDPAKWILNVDTINYLVHNKVSCNLDSIKFKLTRRMIGKYYRYLSQDVFIKELHNGETKFRDWLLYSHSENSLFCFYCLLFGKNKTAFSSEGKGYINWKKCNDQVKNHEKNLVHLKSIQIWFSKQSQNLKTVDKLQKIEILKEESYWREVLYRLVETIKFLSTRGLAFRGDDQTLGSCHNGNYLGFLELLAKFDPLLSIHINKYANKGTGNVSYLSNTVCDELILAMSKTILDKIIQEIKIAKYLSIIIDSTPDMSKIDQLTVAVRYTMLDGSPIERYLGFLPSVGHKADEMECAVLTFLSNLDIDIKNCRGQSYDNAQNMSGIYNGLQARIKKKSPTAEFVPCSTHSLNLVGTFAAEVTNIGNRFFMTNQNLYTFFSGSTSRWKILENQLKNIPNSTLLKNLCPTRWSSRYAVCKSIKNGYPGIIAALQEISKDTSQRPATIYEAVALNKKIENLEFTFMLVLWTPILERFNMASESLQFVDIDLSSVVVLYKSLELYVSELRNNFDILLNEAMCICKKDMFPNESKRQSRRTMFFDEGNAEETVFTEKEKIKNQTFIPIIDALITNLNSRNEAYSKINEKFGFFLMLEKIDNTDLRVKAENLVNTYEEDLDADFIEELIQFKAIFSCMPEIQKTSIHILFKALTTSPIITTFPSIEIALKIFTYLPCSNSSGERSFSVLKRVKTYHRSSLSNEKTSQLSVLCMEAEITKNIDWSELVNKFAKGKARKKLL